jgi:hypothetical protein
LSGQVIHFFPVTSNWHEPEDNRSGGKKPTPQQHQP